MIVITGYHGFVGGHLLASFPPDTVCFEALDLVSGNDIRMCDLPHPDLVSKVYHLAACTDAQCEDTKRIFSHNVMATRRLCKMYGKRVVFASSSMAAYPDTGGPYAESKLLGEQAVHDVGGAIVRFCNLFGDGGHSVIDKFDSADVLQIRGTGDQIRTYAHVSAAVDALLTARPGSFRVLEGLTVTVNQIADWYPKKPRVYVPASQFDIYDGRQRSVKHTGFNRRAPEGGLCLGPPSRAPQP